MWNHGTLSSGLDKSKALVPSAVEVARQELQEIRGCQHFHMDEAEFEPPGF